MGLGSHRDGLAHARGGDGGLHARAPGLTSGAAYAAVERAAVAWQGGACTPASFSLTPTDENTGYRTWDGVNRVAFEDPDDDLPAGVFAATVVYPTGETAFTVGDRSYVYAGYADIVFNDAVPWIVDADIDATCKDAVSIEGAAERELGFALGLAPTCGEDDRAFGLCTDAELEATMGGANPACSADASSLATDDFAGLDDLYTVPFDVTGMPDWFTPTPATVSLAIQTTTPERLVSVETTWSDGTVQSGTEVERKLTHGGLVTAEECPIWDDPACGGCELVDTLLCDDPEVDVSWDLVSGTTYAFEAALVETDGVCWQGDPGWTAVDVDAGTTVATASDWSFTADLGGPGTYLVSFVILDIEGDDHGWQETIEIEAGSDTAPPDTEETAVDSDSDADPTGDTHDSGAAAKGCGCASTTSPGGALALLALAALRRRRR